MTRVESDCPGCRPSSRYCALGRCYCGHPTCPAYDSYTELPTLTDPAPTKKPRTRSSWDDRTETTWIDQL